MYNKWLIGLAPGVNPIQLFTAVFFEFSLYDRVFLPGKLFPPSLIFVGKAKSLPQCRVPEHPSLVPFAQK
jgi:hypothetical protein